VKISFEKAFINQFLRIILSPRYWELFSHWDWGRYSAQKTQSENHCKHFNSVWETIHSFYLQLLQVLIDVQIHIIYLFQIDIIIPCLFRRSRIRSLLTYFCYGRCCQAILKMKIFSNFLIGE
jgi:hypothetical protein